MGGVSCSCCADVDRVFSRRLAARELRRYRKKGPERATATLLDALRREGVEDVSLLDVGGGVGVIQHELLEAGARSAVSVDASRNYAAALLEEAARRGNADRVTTVDGDFVELADGLEPADVATLDKVICCYPDLAALLGAAAARSTRLIGLVYPRDRWFIRAGGVALNAWLWATRNDLRWLIHPPADVDRLLRHAGFERGFLDESSSLIPWQVAVYRRGSENGG